MASFVQLEDNKYKLIGELSDEDIKKINSFKNRTTLVLENTVGLSSELINKISSDRVVFSIKGGLDYEQKDKYKEQKYIDRTFVSPSGLRNIIRYFEYNEEQIDPNWNEFEKAMFLYNALVVDMDYEEDYDNIQSSGTTERSLNGILYGKLVCAGFAQVYKEMLDRIGITNYYQNQKDVHAFNIIEVDGKKYGVDVTWDNNGKKNNNGKCGFGRFGNDPEFYTRHGHQLYKEVDISEDFEKEVIIKVYDTDEEIYDLSLLSMDELNKYYNTIEKSIVIRKPFKYDLKNQSLEIKNRFLPVDIVDYKLKKEANEEYPIVIIMDFLKKRNALTLDDELINAFQSRKGYLLDIGSSNGEYQHGYYDLSQININGYTINRDGNLDLKTDGGIKFDHICGTSAFNSGVTSDELNNVCNSLNKYLNDYLKEYIFNNVKDVDNLLEKFEYKPEEFDTNRFIENANIYSKLSMVANSRNYLIKLGLDQNKVDSVIKNISDKQSEIYRPYESKVIQEESDLDFLSAIFDDINVARQTIEFDQQRPITDEEFVCLYNNVDYITDLYNKYIVIGGDKKFNINDYNVSKEKLQELLKNIMKEYINKKIEDESIQNDNSQESDKHNKSR